MDGTISQSYPVKGFGISKAECLLEWTTRHEYRIWVGKIIWQKATWNTWEM